MRLKVVLVSLVAVVSIILIGSKPLRLGLDLRGGASFVLEARSDDGRPLPVAALRETRRVVERKINAYGVSEATVQPYGAAGDRLLVQIPGSVADLSRVRASLQRQGVLEWFAVMDGPFAGSDEPLRARGGVLGAGERLLTTGAGSSGAAWYIVQASPLIRGDELRNARAEPDAYGGWSTSFTLSTGAGARFARYTEANLGRRVAIVLDGAILSVGAIEDRIQSEGRIRGARSLAEAEDLAILLRAGAIPAAIHIVEEASLDASLGADSIRQGIVAGMAGVAAVVTVLLITYGRAGINATATLLLNGLLLLALLIACDAVLTLPGIAGLILTAGMAVDSNVLVFERIRELRIRQTDAAAVQSGFRRAWATILDTHVTTLISCAFLFWFGTVAVKGFAVTLGLGLVTNLFTAVFVSRLLFEWGLRRGRQVF